MKEKEQNARRYKGKIKILKFKSLFFVLYKQKRKRRKGEERMEGYVFLSPQAKDLQNSGLHTRACLLGTRINTDNPRWSKMAKGKDPKPI